MLAGLPQFVVTVETAKYRTFFVQPIGTLCEHGTISFGLVEEILDTLVALGHTRRTDSGYAPA